MSLGRKLAFSLALSGAVGFAGAAAVLFALASKQGAIDVQAALGTAVLAVAVGLGLYWFLLRRLLLNPLAALSQWVVHAARAQNQPAVSPREVLSLGHHGAAVGALVEALGVSRRSLEDAARMAAARAESDKRRLEAILQDLNEAVVLCNLEHRISLYNERASHLFGGPERIGLGRSIFDLVEAEALHTAFESIARLLTTGSRATVPVAVIPLDAAAAFDGHVGSIVEADGRLSGFVLSIAGRLSAKDSESRSAVPPSVPASGGAAIPPRPEFYDFALLERPAAANVAFDARALMDLDYVVFDTETTGLRPAADELVAIAGVRVVNGRIRQSEIFERLIDPGRPIPPASTRIHGITDIMITGKPPARIVLPQFHRFAKGAVLIAHNIAFDLAFLARKEAESGVIFDNPVLDTLLLSRFLDPGESDHSLDALTARLGVVIAGRHTARGDAEATAAVFVLLLERLSQRGVTTFEAARRACGGRRALAPPTLDI